MPFSRKNWSALSSLAQQWSTEDEEEQERERRRRHRQLSSTTEVKEETSSPVQDATSRTPNRFRGSLEVKPPRQGNSKPANERTLEEVINKPEDRVRRRVEMFNNVKQEKKETVTARKWKEETAEKKAKPSSGPPQEKKEPTVEEGEGLSQQREPDEEKHQNLSEEKKVESSEKQENSDQNKEDPQVGEDSVFSKEREAPKEQQSQRPAAVQNEVTPQQPLRASWERRSISRLEVKINPRVRSFMEAAPDASGPQAAERSRLKTEEAASSPSGQDGSEAPLLTSQPLITYSSSFKRVSPRTISFRVVPRKEKQDDTLSRSASMRLPASTAKLEEKLEKYTSAVQRAGSIKLPPSARRNFHPPSEGVASKRSIFETTVPIRAETTTPVRKESLKIPGGVTSRINLWISRTQEPSKDEGTKDIQKIENSAEWSRLEKRPDNS